MTANGVHIMAFLGGLQWIEADPGVGRVITATVGQDVNSWFGLPMRIMRWTVLRP